MTAAETPDLLSQDAYACWTRERARYGDMDRQGHVNNAVFSTYFESGRVNMIYDSTGPLAPTGTAFVVARIVIDYRAEIHWRDEVDVGSIILRFGNSSMTIGQGLFVGSRCAATAEGVFVLVEQSTRRSTIIPDALRHALQPYVNPQPFPRHVV